MAKNIKWIDIDCSRKTEVRFTPLNESSEKTPRFEIKRDEGGSRETTKSKILATTLYDAVMRYRSNLVNEEKKPNLSNHKFFGRDEWQQFEKHGEMIAKFMGASSDEITQALEKMKKVFSTLGGSAGPDEGLRILNELDTAFKDAGIDTLEPRIRMTKFIELLAPQSYTVSTGRGKNRTEEERIKEYDVGTFIKMIINRKNRPNLKNILLKTDGITPKQIMDKVFGKEFGDNIEKAYDIFRKIVELDNYKKLDANIGKAEIAFAMFFGDCRLAEKKGDIEFTKGGTSVEVKGLTGGISDRTPLLKEIRDIKNLSWEQSKMTGGKKLPEQIRDKILQDVKSHEYTSEDIGVKISELVHEYGSKYDITQLKYEIMFGALTVPYFREFDTMIVMNMKNDIANDGSSSKMMNSPIMKVPGIGKGAGNWYDEAINILKNLDSQGLCAKLANRAGNEYVFKVFTKSSRGA